MKSFNETWEKIHNQLEWGKYPSENVIRFIARNYYQTQRDKVKILDFGCGAGANTWFLAREGFDVYAFDGSSTAIEKAKQYLASERCGNVHFSVMDGTMLDYPDDFFDCVVDNVCIYANTYPHIRKMYQEIFRIMKNGGKLYSSCFGPKTEGFRTGTYLENGTYEDIEKGVLANRGTAHIYTEQEFVQTLEETGFSNIHIDVMQYTDDGKAVEMFMAKAEKA